VYLIRYALRSDPIPRVGVLDDAGARAIDVASLGALLARPVAEIRAMVNSTPGPTVPASELVLLPPADTRMEVWAAGVTYRRSRTARMEESATADIYELVYDAARPELFFKAMAWRVVTDGEPIAIRRDSSLNVPEAELAVVGNAGGEIVGYTACNDVSSRSIEGENPLYLPQAKVYTGSCALAPGVRPVWEVDATDLTISLRIERGGKVAWTGETSTAELHRPLDALVGCLFEEQDFPDGVIVSTGTGIVPEMDFTLMAGDLVAIKVDQVGSLRNRVVAGKPSLSWLSDRQSRA
jgi:2-dehydro-3-deoxy-D-arabinonate dehydratase